MAIPVIADEALKVKNLEIILPLPVIFSSEKVQRLFQIKLEIIDNSAAKPLATPLIKETDKISGVNKFLKIRPPTILTTKPIPPTIANLINF